MDLAYVFPDDLLAEQNDVHTIIRDHWLVLNYTVNKDKSVNVQGDVRFPDFASFLTKLPLQFNKVSGNFDISTLVNLTTLKGSPVEVGGVFNCSYTNINSLQHAPKKASKLIFDNNLRSLSTGNLNCNFDEVSILFVNSDPVDGLPSMIIKYSDFLPTIVKYQSYFDVWGDNNKDPFNQDGFAELITEISEGLK
ncbi:hypothetical protein [Flavobacterium hydrophilum]|uniref:Calcium-binding protein n=1 Tax=Flavobacterium hydrophilum TaxID=2211445 RepID=A0A2V4C554_9FLAO|nr:hypothetical protein [Flavobacterium hydrophilum]PXY45243.1 hypothetical protein DMB68_11165 [Flavobacterium hydrophilum]